jgi:ornithine cyclodeaminase/alanine dehydrogenase-like protein (mu-crystallin family)
MSIKGPLKERLLAATTLPEVVALKNFARNKNDVTLFKSVGSAAQDIASAKSIYDVATELGLGRDVGVLAEQKIF